jgi:hypothetical protein
MPSSGATLPLRSVKECLDVRMAGYFYETSLTTGALNGRVLYMLQLIARFELPVNLILSAMIFVQLVLVLAPPA